VALVLLVQKPATSESTRPLSPPPAPVATVPAQPAPTVGAAPPVSLVAEPVPGFKLTGIMQDTDGSYLAVLNGRPVAAGQFVDGATVKRIERDRLILEVNGHESTVPYNR
jgi:type II secretory pathway component PulC